MIVAVPIGLIVYTMYEEGVFDTTKKSVLILVAGINKFRQLNKDDLSDVEEMQARDRELARKMENEGNRLGEEQ